MVVEGPKARGSVKPFKFAAAFVAINTRGDTFIQDPVDEGKDRETQAVRPGDEEDGDDNGEAAEELIEILRDIELGALTDRTLVKDDIEGTYFSHRMGAVETDKVSRAGVYFRITLAGVTSKGEGLFQRAIPNFTR